MFDNSITANKATGMTELLPIAADGINWNGKMIKNPINHAALMDGEM